MKKKSVCDESGFAVTEDFSQWKPKVGDKVCRYGSPTYPDTIAIVTEVHEGKSPLTYDAIDFFTGKKTTNIGVDDYEPLRPDTLVDWVKEIYDMR